MAYSPNPTWQDYPDTTTPITAAALQHIESGIQDAAATADDAVAGLADKVDVADAVSLSAATPAAQTNDGFAGSANTAARGDHSHPITMPQYGLGATGVNAWYVQPMGAKASANNPAATSKCPGVAVPVYRAGNITDIVIDVSAAADGGTAALALYRCGANGLPTGAAVWTGSTFTATSTGKKDHSGLTIAVTPGLYMLFLGSTGFTTNRARPFGLRTLDYALQFLPASSATGATNSDNTPCAWLTGFNETTGAWPTLTGSITELTATTNSTSSFWYAIRMA